MPLNLPGAVKRAIVSSTERNTRISIGPFRGVKIRAIPSQTMQLRYGLWERETYPYLRRALRESDWLVDIGAGGGEMCIAYAMAKPAGSAVAVEPYRAPLEANLALNPGVRVTIDNREVGTGERQTPLSEFVQTGPGFIKIDVDGAELDVLQSGRDALRERRPLLLIETHSKALEGQSLDFASSIGYRAKVIQNAWWRAVVPEQRPLEQNRWLWAEP